MRFRAAYKASVVFALIAAALILGAASLTKRAQGVSRPIPREFAGYRLGMQAESLPGYPHGCGPTNYTAETYCEISPTLDILLVRDTVYMISRGYVVPRDDLGATSAEVWRRYAGPRAIELFGAPDTVVSLGDTVTTAWWNPVGRRGLTVEVFRFDHQWGVSHNLTCRSATRVPKDMDFTACLRGDRP